ncbi:MAG TPA: baseplate J/gp47 family protein [Candidatus Anaerotignum merdipullorum]|nr:baseplate J/gp47 family protein [Candidatus Anaerotignum merdipullorum]
MAEEFDFVQTDAAKIYTTVMNWLMDSVNEPLYPGDERRIYGEALIFVLVNVYNEMNDTAKQRTLQYARGYVLDALGERVGAVRLQPSPAYDTFRFSLSAAQSQNIIIPAGTRITPDGSVYFATDETAIIQSGETFVDVRVTCDTAGTDYNGMAAGTIKTLVDLIPYVASVSNLNGTTGGDDGEPYTTEGDDRFRERIRLAPSSFSVAGPLAAYRYYALSADPDIIDVYINSPTANNIVIVPLMTGGTIPDSDTIQKVKDVFADDIRPLTDIVTVQAPMQVSYDINIKYYCTLDNEADAITIVEAAGGAIEQYNAWQCGALGRDINPDQLKKFILAPSSGSDAVERVDIVSPTFQELASNKVAKYSGTLTVTHAIIGGDSA